MLTKKKQLVFIGADSGGPQFAMILIAIKLISMGYSVRLYLTGEMSAKVEEFGIQDYVRISSYNLYNRSRGSVIYTGRASASELLANARPLYEELIPPVIVLLQRDIELGLISPANSILVTNSAAVIYAGIQFMSLGFREFYTLEPYWFVDFMGAWGKQRSQMFPAVAVSISRAVLHKGNHTGFLGLLERLSILNSDWRELMKCICGQIHMISPQLSQHEDNPAKGYYITGYTHQHKNGLELPQPILNFLNRNDRPVVAVTFGSMAFSTEMADKVIKTYIKAIEHLNIRLLFIGSIFQGHSNGDVMFHTDTVPYSVLFPVVDVVSSHSGSGTMHETLWAGKPHIPIPILGDQEVWAKLLVNLGLAPGYINMGDLESSELQRLLMYATISGVYRENAVSFSETMNVASNNGITNIARILAIAADK